MPEITLEQRVDALERQNRRLRSWAGVLTALLFVPVFAAATGGQSAEVVRAGGFEVVRNGRVVAQLDSDAGGGRVIVRSAAGTHAGYLKGTAIGGSLDVSDATGRAVGYLDATKAGGAKLCVYNGEGKCVATLYSADGGGAFEIMDRSGTKAATLSTPLMGGGVLTILDSQGRRAAYLKSGAWGGSLDISKRGETVGYFDAASSETTGDAILCVGKTPTGCINRIPR